MRRKPLKVPLPHISGTDAAGEVIAVGEDVTTIKVGDRVVSHGNIACRVCKACTDGREYDCKSRKVWGFQTGPLWGGFCEITHLPEVNVVKIQDSMRYEDAAAASMVLMTLAHACWAGKDKARTNSSSDGRWLWHGYIWNPDCKAVWL